MKNPNAKWKYPAITSFGLGNYSVRTTRYRFIQYLDGSQELYDHKEDPHEWNNLASNPEYKVTIAKHEKHIPKKQHEILPGKSTGHKAYGAARKHVDGI